MTDKKQFNSKYAIDLGGLEGLSDYNVQIDPTVEDYFKYDESDRHEGSEKPTTYYIKRPDEELRPNENVASPEENAAFWNKKAQEVKARWARGDSSGKDSFSGSFPHEAYLREHEENKKKINATYASVDYMLRHSEAYRCPNPVFNKDGVQVGGGCGGRKNGGNPSVGYETQKLAKQKFCPMCLNQGHVLTKWAVVNKPEYRIKDEETNQFRGLRAGDRISSPTKHYVYSATGKQPLDTSIMDISGRARQINSAINFHDTWCTSKKCHVECAFKPQVDQVRKRIGINNVKKKDTHNRSKSSAYIQDLLRPIAVRDRYQEPAKALIMAAGHEDDPIRKHDMVHFLNWNTVDPDYSLDKPDEGFHEFVDTYTRKEFNHQTGEISEVADWTDRQPGPDSLSPHVKPENSVIAQNACAKCGMSKGNINHIAKQRMYTKEDREKIENMFQGRSSRDKAVAGVVLNAGQHTADVAVYYRPMGAIRGERSGELGRKVQDRPDKQIQIEKTINGVPTIDGFSNPNEDTRFNKRPKIYKDVITHIKNAHQSIAHFTGEKSPLNDVGYWQIHTSVPKTALSRLSPANAPMVGYAGVITSTLPATSITGSYPGGKKINPLKKVKMDVVYRNGIGLSQDEIKNSVRSSDSTTRQRMDQWSRELANDLQLGVKQTGTVDYNHKDSLVVPIGGNELKPHGLEKRRITPGENKFNSNTPTLDDKPFDSIPYDITPDSEKQLSPEKESSTMDVVKSTYKQVTGKDIFPEQYERAKKSIRENNNINAGLEELGIGEEDGE
jgi:hypothetical protein